MTENPDDVKQLFVKEKPCRILLYIRRNTGEAYATEASRNVDTTFTHAIKIIGRMEGHGLIEKEGRGRKELISITEKGERIASKLSKLTRELNKIERNQD